MTTGSEIESTQKSIDVLEIGALLWKSKKLLAYVTGAVVLVAVIVSFLLPEYFKSTATLLPETKKNQLSSLGGIADLASLAGVNIGSEVPLVKLYPTIAKSEAVLNNVIYAQYETKAGKMDLVRYWKITGESPQHEYEQALKVMREQLEVLLDNRTSVISISIETKEPRLSADIVNNITGELDRFMRSKRLSNASEQRKWIESRMTEVKQDLDKSENALKDFREKNRRPNDSPLLLLEQERLIREVQINSTVYIELKKQLEVAKIEEIKNIPIISVMDSARPSAYRESPKRRNIVLVSFFLAGLFSALFVVVRSLHGDRVMALVRRLQNLVA